MSVCNYVWRVDVSLSKSPLSVSSVSHGVVSVWGIRAPTPVCPPMALILGMLEALGVPPPATRRGLYPALLWGSPTVVPVRSSARKSLLSGV